MKDGKILIVDDTPANLQLLGMTLRGEGYQVIATSKSTQVVESAKKSNPDLILLDVMMPVLNGFEVCEQLKNDQTLVEIPVIFLTAKSEQENINYGLEVGGVDYITKPFNKQELLSRVETHISLKLSKDEIARQREELAKAVDFKNRIFSVIGHDLRSPVSGISGALELILEMLKEQVKDEFASMKQIASLSHSASVELGAMLDDLLSWGQLESGSFKSHQHAFKLCNVLEMVEKLNSYQLSSKKIEIISTCDPGLEIYSDRRVIATIIRNLQSNAIKFSNHGSEIHTKVEKYEDEIRILVQDFGQGMPEEVRDAMFNESHHPKDFSMKNKSGAGVGLMICKRLATAIGADITVESKVDEGTTFTLIIPNAVQTEKSNTES
ncbi:MAG: hybrid sensor histidine kinase/response regulator [Balneolaceae bacterium]|nr:hybrid sensor histidine kinase/response regulator [Balneolaceae bacterium]